MYCTQLRLPHAAQMGMMMIQRYTPASIVYCFQLNFMNKIMFFQNDPATLLKCLTIASAMMEGTALTTIIPSLRTLTEVLVGE